MDCSFEIICVKCFKGENLLLCNENGCPMAVHKRCMGCPATFDDVGNFYCPYCLYKKAVSDLRQAEEIAKSKRKDLFIFLHGERKGAEEHLRANNKDKAKLPNKLEVNVASVSMLTRSGKRRQDEEHDTRDAEKVNNHEKNTGKVSGSGYLDLSIVIHKDHCVNTSDERKIQEETYKLSDHEQSLKRIEEHKFNNDDDEEEKVEEDISDSSGQEKNVREKLETSDSSSDQGSSHKKHKKEKINNAGKKKINKGKRKINRSDLIDSNDVVDSMPIKHKKTQKYTNMSTPRIMSLNHASSSERRQRLRWSEEEVEMLKVGVQKFSNPEHNIPWRKILDFGRHVFHETRFPADLKDKWRKLDNKHMAITLSLP